MNHLSAKNKNAITLNVAISTLYNFTIGENQFYRNEGAKQFRIMEII